MTTNASVEFHMRFVRERHQDLVGSLDTLVKVLVSEDLQSKKTHAQTAFKKASDLQSAVSKQDCPSWLPSLIDGLGHFINNNWNPSNLIDHLIKNIATIKEHTWVFEKQSETAFDFDSIFEHYKSASRLPELFDEIVRILEEIEASGEIDSLTMITALGKVITTIKKNRNGSYFSLNSAWSFLIAFLKNYMYAELSKIPLLGTALESLEKTINETNEEMFKVHNQVKSEMARKVETEIKGLKNKTSFGFIGYNESGIAVNETAGYISLSETV